MGQQPKLLKVAGKSTPNVSQASDAVQTGEIWHALDNTDLFRKLDTSVDKGLTTDEAERRIQKHGYNELKEAPQPSFFQLILDQLNNFIVIILIVSSIVSAIMGDYIESAAIIMIVILNAVLGVVQEKRAEEALAALRKLAAPEAHVIRDGFHKIIPSRELVPGDVVILESGNYIPADLRLLESVNLRIEEAALTGESIAVEKDARVVLQQDIPLGDRRNTAFSGTLVSYGRGKGVVVSTGMHTQIGMIAAMLQAVHEEPTPLQRRLDQLGKTLGIASLAVCGIVFVVGWIYGNDPKQMLLIAVSLAIAAVPEGLAAVVTITLALGMREMIKRHALIRRLASVETLGSTTVICSDKTGTLTQNQMTVTQLWVDGKYFDVTGHGTELNGQFTSEKQPIDLKDYRGVSTVLWGAVLNNDGEIEVSESSDDQPRIHLVGDPTETALLVAAGKAGAGRKELELAYPRINEIPFDSVRKRMTTIHAVLNPHTGDASPFNDDSRREWRAVAVTKGAPDVVLDLCTHYQQMNDQPAPLTNEVRQRISDANDAMSKSALRVLAIAFRREQQNLDEVTPEKVEKGLTFGGLVGMIDPARPQVAAAVETARKAGIKTIMITGDYANTARAVADEIGLLHTDHKLLTGAQLSQMDDEQLQQEVLYTDVYARVSPEHKVRIVEALKHHREIVSMTGDGVNDAPALKRADIGVAMGITGTDVAKETADMVLTDDNYASIVAAVEQGRIIYSNIRKFVYYLISCNLAEIAIIFLAILAGLPSPLTAIQLLWLNLITDGAPALALGAEKGDPYIMDQPPRPTDEPIINKSMRLGVAIQTVVITAVTLGAFIIGLNAYPDSPAISRTMAFLTLSFSELLRASTARSERHPLYKIGFFSNRWMIYAELSSLALLMAVIYIPFLQPVFNTTPLGWEQWKIVLPLLLAPSIAAELSKLLSHHLFYRKES